MMGRGAPFYSPFHSAVWGSAFGSNSASAAAAASAACNAKASYNGGSPNGGNNNSSSGGSTNNNNNFAYPHGISGSKCGSWGLYLDSNKFLPLIFCQIFWRREFLINTDVLIFLIITGTWL